MNSYTLSYLNKNSLWTYTDRTFLKKLCCTNRTWYLKQCFNILTQKSMRQRHRECDHLLPAQALQFPYKCQIPWIVFPLANSTLDLNRTPSTQNKWISTFTRPSVVIRTSSVIVMVVRRWLVILSGVHKITHHIVVF